MPAVMARTAPRLLVIPNAWRAMMIPRNDPHRDRFSNRQAAVFVIAVVLGLIGGIVTNTIAGGLMLGAVVGALAIVVPGVRDRPDETSSHDPEPPSGQS